MTFLEFLCRKLLGPASSQGHRTTWPCPACGSTRAFSTLPHRAEYKDRFICHRCNFRGDEPDLVRFYFPREPWPARQARLAAWWEEYQRGEQPAGDGIGHIPPRGRGTQQNVNVSDRDPADIAADEFSPAADAAITAIDATAVEVLAVLGLPPTIANTLELLALCKTVLEACIRGNLHPLSLVGRIGFELWRRRDNLEHTQACDNPTCDWYCCMEDRGEQTERLRREMRGVGRG